jgi:hypothetical protein
MRWVLAPLMIAGCHGHAATSDGAASDAAIDAVPQGVLQPDDGAHSGSRLKIMYWAAPDGTKVWRGTFLDTQLGEQCVPAPWVDGSTYCTPPNMDLIDWHRSWFTTMWGPRGFVPPLPASSRFTVTMQDTPCFNQNISYVPPPHQVVQLLENGTVVAPDATLVKLEITRGPVDADGLALVSLTAADGFQFPLHPYSTALGDDCEMGANTPGAPTAWCVPRDLYTGLLQNLYADATCDQQVYSIHAACGSMPVLGVVTMGDFGAPLATMYVKNAGAVTSALHVYDTSGCHAATPDPTLDYYAWGAPVEAPKLSRVPATLAGHRLQLVHQVSGVGYSGRDAALYDTLNQVECVLADVPNSDRVQCVPSTCGGGVTTVFTDPACQSPKLVYDAETCNGVPPPSSVGPAITAPMYGLFHVSQTELQCGLYRPGLYEPGSYQPPTYGPFELLVTVVDP